MFACCAGLSLVWLAAAAGMRASGGGKVNRLAPVTFSIASGVELQGLRESLARQRGVHAAEVLEKERLARVTVVPGEWDENSVRRILTGEA